MLGLWKFVVFGNFKIKLKIGFRQSITSLLRNRERFWNKTEKTIFLKKKTIILIEYGL